MRLLDMWLALRCFVRNKAALVSAIVFGIMGWYFVFIYAYDVELWKQIAGALCFLGMIMGSLLMTARETFVIYKSVTAVLERYGSKSTAFQNIRPVAYCDVVGYDMAVRDFTKG